MIKILKSSINLYLMIKFQGLIKIFTFINIYLYSFIVHYKKNVHVSSFLNVKYKNKIMNFLYFVILLL